MERAGCVWHEIAASQSGRDRRKSEVPAEVSMHIPSSSKFLEVDCSPASYKTSTRRTALPTASNGRCNDGVRAKRYAGVKLCPRREGKVLAKGARCRSNKVRVSRGSSSAPPIPNEAEGQRLHTRTRFVIWEKIPSRAAQLSNLLADRDDAAEGRSLPPSKGAAGNGDGKMQEDLTRSVDESNSDKGNKRAGEGDGEGEEPPSKRVRTEEDGPGDGRRENTGDEPAPAPAKVVEEKPHDDRDRAEGKGKKKGKKDKGQNKGRKFMLQGESIRLCVHTARGESVCPKEL